MEIRAVQAAAGESKLAKGFNVTDVPLEFCLLNSSATSPRKREYIE